MVPEALARGTDVLRRAVSLLQDRLPPAWTTTVSLAFDVPGPRSRRADALIELRGPGTAGVRLLAEFKPRTVTRDLPAVVEHLRGLQAGIPFPTVPLVVSRYLSESVRRWLDDRGISHLDATGNLRVLSSDPVVYLRDRGADQDPWRLPGRPRGTLKGPPAARVVRALADLRAPLPISVLVARSGASTGAAYRVLEFLEEEALITRGARGLVETVRWRPMLERWSQDYSFQQDSTVVRYLEPRGVTALLTKLAKLTEPIGYAVTGSLAARRLAPYADARLAMVYASDLAAFADTLGLREVDAGANVLLGTPASDVVFDRTTVVDGVVYAAASQVAVDLLTGSGRNPAEGQELLTWMENNEPDWRS